MDLKGKVALITGGGTGLGREVALLLGAEGCNVAINYVPVVQEAALKTRDDVAALGVKAIAVEGDVTKGAAVERMVAEVGEKLGPVDILVCSAGTTVHVPFPDLHKISDDDWDRVMAVNVKGAFVCARTVVPMMRASGGGRIVNVASAAGLTPFYGSSIPYDVSKSGIIMLTKCLARALAPDDILVNAVAPSMMRTSWWGSATEETLHRAELGIPLKRAAYVEDVAAGIMYLIKNDSTTGHTLAIDGGSSMY